LTGKFDLTNVNNMAFYISGPKVLFETTEISTHPNSTQQESNYIYLYTTKFGTSITIRLNRKFESTEFETMRVNCMFNVYKNQPSRQTGSRNVTGSKTLPTIWGTYMKLVTKYQISTINSCWEKCDEKYLWTDGQR
jgi:hypothetical protein